MTKHSKREREQRQELNERMRMIEAAMISRIPADQAKAFEERVREVRAQGPRPQPEDMAPGTPPRPPRPGHEPRPPKDKNARPKRY